MGIGGLAEVGMTSLIVIEASVEVKRFLHHAIISEGQS